MRISIKLFLSVFALAYLSEACAVSVQLPAPTKQIAINANKNYAPIAPAKIMVPVSNSGSFQVSATMEPGSLRANIKRLAQQFGWPQVVWDVSNDYEWVGTARISGANFNSILEKILVNYPLQATLYHGNHVLVISSRNL